MTSVRNKEFIAKSLIECPLQNFEKDIRVTDDLECAVWQIPHKEKKELGGEDTYFISRTGNSVGVFDGVGGWIDQGINPRQFSYKLMVGCTKAADELNESNPIKILIYGYHFVTTYKTIGSCTATVVSFLKNDSIIKMEAVNLGDSGFLVFRKDNDQEGRVYLRTKEQQHGFNMPYQLSSEPTSDKPQTGNKYSSTLEYGDIVVLGTDGVWDNLFEYEINKLLFDHHNQTSQLIAKEIASAALISSLNKTRLSPFSQNANNYYRKKVYDGGKPDDITVLVVKVQKRSKL